MGNDRAAASATAGSYLKQYVERVSEVPAYLQRHLALIRNLDDQAMSLGNEIEEQSKRQMLANGGYRRRSNPDQAQQFDIQNAITRLLGLADEKVTIAAQVYDFIDKHIQVLDEDLRQLDKEIQSDKESLGVGAEETACGRLGVEVTKVRKTKAGVQVEQEKKKAGRRGKAVEEVIDPGPAIAPVVNEPLYCYCQKPSFGQMVACDNDECPYEWFHFACVGITAAPQDGETWYCPECAKTKG